MPRAINFKKHKAMTKIHGLNIFILFVWMMLTCGGLGNAAYKYDSIYWVPFIVNAIIAIVLGYKEAKAMRIEAEKKVGK